MARELNPFFFRVADLIGFVYCFDLFFSAPSSQRVLRRRLRAIITPRTYYIM